MILAFYKMKYTSIVLKSVKKRTAALTPIPPNVCSFAPMNFTIHIHIWMTVNLQWQR